MQNHSRKKIPKISPLIQTQIINLVIENKVLEQMTLLIMNFLNVTWLMDNKKCIDAIREKVFKPNMRKLVLNVARSGLNINFSEDNIEPILQCIMKQFSNDLDNNIFFQKFFLNNYLKDRPFIAAADALAGIYILEKLSYETQAMMNHPNVVAEYRHFSTKNQSPPLILKNTLDLRINFFKDTLSLIHI